MTERTLALLSILALVLTVSFGCTSRPACTAQNRCISAEAMVEQDIDESEVVELVAAGWSVGE